MTITDLQSYKPVNPTELPALVRLHGNNNIWLTGISGSGKDYLVDSYLREFNFFPLDSIGWVANGHWVPDVSKYRPESGLYRVYGQTNYPDELANVMHTTRPELMVIWVSPDPGLFRMTQIAKAHTASPNNRWIKDWERMSVYDDDEVASYDAENFRHFIKHSNPTRIVVVTNSPNSVTDHIVYGWHRPVKDYLE